MFPQLIGNTLTKPQAWFALIVEIVLLGLFLALAWWILERWIIPNVPEPFRWIIDVFIGLALLGLLFVLFFGTF
jgi:hypothetical protein